MGRKILLTVLLANILYSQQQADIPWPSLANSPWPMIKHDPQFTGRSPFKGPQSATIKWTVDMPYGIFSGPVIGEEGNLYFGSYYNFGDYFYCYNTDGDQMWNYKLGKVYPPRSGIVVDSSNTIYFGASDKFFYALNPDGTLKWEFGTSAAFGFTITNIDLQGNLYLPNDSGTLFSFSPLGNLNWNVTYESGFRSRSPVFSPDGSTIYIAGRDSNLFALNLDGSIKWKFICKQIRSAPAVDNAGNLYFADELYFYSISSDGEINWNYGELYFDMYSIPAIDYSGNIFAIATDTISPFYKILLSFTFDGNIRWQYVFDDQINDDFWQPLICDSEGTIYVGSTMGYNYYAISNDGSLLWKMPLDIAEQQVDFTGTIADDGTLYLGVHGASFIQNSMRTLIAIRDTVTSVKDENTMILDYNLQQNFPNPFNSSTNIRYTIPQSGRVTLKVFDLIGSEVLTLLDRYQESGSYDVIFQARDLASGIYFYTLASGNFTATKKLILLK
ncbi:MAG: PQQ-binding-like beta-propeller repeat protein [Ignavibacteriaceae bacterium]|nr:PQQ-binding-like beta-propeller repeat protein [Ignavibacteriaceae bacterium]